MKDNMIKIMLLLLLSSSILTTHSIQTNDFPDKELSPNEKKRAYVYTVIESLVISKALGEMLASCLPKGTPPGVTTAVSISTALATLGAEILILQEKENITDFYKNRKWFLYLEDGLALVVAMLAANGLKNAIQGTSSC